MAPGIVMKDGYRTASQLNNCTTAQLLNFNNLRAAQLHNCMTWQLHNCTTSQLHNCTTSQLHNCTTSQLHTFTTSQLHTFTTSQLHNFTTAQPHNCTTVPMHNLRIAKLHNFTMEQFPLVVTSRREIPAENRALQVRQRNHSITEIDLLYFWNWSSLLEAMRETWIYILETDRVLRKLYWSRIQCFNVSMSISMCLIRSI